MSEPLSGPPLLQLQGIQAGYGSTPVLRGLDLELGRREFVVVVGSSGGGKSTLLRVAAGLLAPEAGTARFQGRPIQGPPRGIQVVFQQYSQSLFPWLCVAGNLRLALLAEKLAPAEERQRVEQALRLVGLWEQAAALPNTLSGGMAQRVAIARALAARPALLCMDEPFGSLDAVTRRGLQDQLLDLPQRPATLFVSHDVDEALYLADRVVLLRPGQPLLELAPDLPWPRDQVRTPALPAFQRARAALMAMLEESS